MLTHAIVTKVFGPTDKNKEGKPFLTKGQKPYRKIAIKTDKTGEEWWSTLLFDADAKEGNIKEGDELLLSFDKTSGYNNFKIPTKFDLVEAKVEELEKRIKSLERVTGTPHGQPNFDKKPEQIATPMAAAVDEIDPNDIPFN